MPDEDKKAIAAFRAKPNLIVPQKVKSPILGRKHSPKTLHEAENRQDTPIKEQLIVPE
jgi:hypothetical protein